MHTGWSICPFYDMFLFYFQLLLDNSTLENLNKTESGPLKKKMLYIDLWRKIMQKEEYRWKMSACEQLNLNPLLVGAHGALLKTMFEIGWSKMKKLNTTEFSSFVPWIFRNWAVTTSFAKILTIHFHGVLLIPIN